MPVQRNRGEGAPWPSTEVERLAMAKSMPGTMNTNTEHAHTLVTSLKMEVSSCVLHESWQGATSDDM